MNQPIQPNGKYRFQIGNKFRDECSPKRGLMRAKEFIMKDLYTFDIDREATLRTYEEVNEAYGKLFSTIGVPFLKGATELIPIVCSLCIHRTIACDF